jgi:hypothetical protein
VSQRRTFKGKSGRTVKHIFWFGILEWRCASAIQIVPRENSRLTRSPNSNQLFAKVAYAKTVAEAMNLKLDMDNSADRERLRRAVLDLVAGRKMRKQKPRG